MSLYDPQQRNATAAGRVGMALLRLSQAVKKLAAIEAEDAGLTPVQAQTLLFVHHTKPFLATVGRLAAALGATHVTAIGVIHGLERRGLLTTEQSRADRRVTLLRLTPAGMAACTGLERFGATLKAALDALDPDDLAALDRHLGALVWSLRAAGALQVAEPCRGCRHFQPDVAPGSPEPHRCALIDAYLSEAVSRLDCPDHTPAAD